MGPLCGGGDSVALRAGRSRGVLAQRFADEPMVARRIGDPALPHPVRLVGHRKYDLRAGGCRSVRHSVRIFDDEAHTHARSAEGRRTDIECRWVLVNGGEALTVDRHLDDELPGRSRLPRELDRPECLLVKLDDAARILDREERSHLYARHTSISSLAWIRCARRAPSRTSPFAQHTATRASPP